MPYRLQTEALRPDGGTGFPGLRLRGDLLGSADGLAQAPYIRESRRHVPDRPAPVVRRPTTTPTWPAARALILRRLHPVEWNVGEAAGLLAVQPRSSSPIRICCLPKASN